MGGRDLTPVRTQRLIDNYLHQRASAVIHQLVDGHARDEQHGGERHQPAAELRPRRVLVLAVGDAAPLHTAEDEDSRHDEGSAVLPADTPPQPRTEAHHPLNISGESVCAVHPAEDGRLTEGQEQKWHSSGLVVEQVQDVCTPLLQGRLPDQNIG